MSKSQPPDGGHGHRLQWCPQDSDLQIRPTVEAAPRNRGGFFVRFRIPHKAERPAFVVSAAMPVGRGILYGGRLECFCVFLSF